MADQVIAKGARMSIIKDILEQRGMGGRPCCPGCGMRMRMQQGNCPDCGVKYGLSMGAADAPGMSEGTETTDAKSDVDNSEASMNKIGKKAKASKIVFSQGEDDSTKRVQEDIDTAEYSIKQYVDQDGETKTRKIRPHRIDFKNSKSGAKPSQQDDSTKRVQEDMKTTYKDMITVYAQMRSESLQLEDEINEVLSKDASAGDWISDFVHSDNPKFAGKSKEKRKQMALAAYYAKQKNEEALPEASDGTSRELTATERNKLGTMAAMIAKEREEKQARDTAKALAQRGLKKAKTNEDVEIDEGTGSLKPGWMLKKDPELAKKVKEKIDLAKKRQATYGDKSAGKSVSEEIELDEESTYKKVGVKNLDDWKAHAKKHGYTVQKLSDTHHQAWREGQHGGAHLTGTHFAGNKDHKSEQWMRIPKKVSEEVEEIDEAEYKISTAQMGHAGKTTIKHIKNPDVTQRMAAHDVKSYADRIALLKDAKRKGNLKEEEMNEELHPDADKVLKHIKPEHHAKYTPDLTKKHYTGNYADRTAVLKAAERAGHLKESVFDWKNNPRETKDKTKTSTYHDVKKISTGTEYTKQFDKDGTSKGTGGDAAAKAENAPKRGRGRPKKDKFAESVEILMSLSEDQFDSMMEDGFDTFFEAFEQLDEESKAALKSCGKSTK